MKSKLWSQKEIIVLEQQIRLGKTNREIYESNLLPDRTFRSIKDKRTEVSMEMQPYENPAFVSANYAKRTRAEAISGLRDTFGITDAMEQMIRLKEEDEYTYQQIADETDNSFNYIKQRMEEWAIFKRTYEAVFDRLPDVDEVFNEYNETEDEYAFEEIWDIFNDWLGRRKQEINTPTIESADDILKKYLIIQDTHIPFHDEEFLVDIIEKHKHEVDEVILAGDFLDCYSVSFFPKYKEVTLREELVEGVKVLQYLSENIKNVRILTGNHDKRVYKAAHRQLDKNMVFLVQTNLLEFIARGFALETVGKEFSNVTVSTNWYHQVGDAIIGHPDIYSKVDLKSAVSSYEWFRKWRGRLNLDPFRFISHAHTHHAGITYREEDGSLCMLVETGSCCMVQDYAIRGEGKGKYTPPQNGYVVLVQKDGKTDLNETRLFIQNVVDGETFM